MVSGIKMLEELKEVLAKEETRDENYISLYYLKELMYEKRCEYIDIIDSYERYFKNRIKENYDLTASFLVHDFDYKKNRLVLSFLSRYSDDWQRLIYIKKDNNLISLNQKAYSSDEIKDLLGEELIDMYDEFMEFHDFMTQNIYFKEIKDTNFKLSIIDPYLTINYRNKETEMLDDFDLSYNDKENEYEYDTKYEDIANLISYNEDQIFKKLFVNIEDCPKWSRESLYEIRKKELEKSKQKVLN